MNIELRHIHKYFGPVHANDDVSVTFEGGKIYGILGENGAGKSTLMKILSGFQPPDSGEIWIDGKRAEYHNPQAAIGAGIGMLQQDPLDVPAFSVLENFVYGQPFTRREAKQKLSEISRRFGFDLDADTPIGLLSIAQRQQLEIVRLLAYGVRALILDEPTTGISAEQKTILFNTLQALARDDGMIILLVSHKLEDVVMLCNEVVVLRAGRITSTSKQRPTTTMELVRLMFGQELAEQTRAQVGFGETAIALDNVVLHTKRFTIDKVRIAVRAGEVIGLAGLDGSGQETFMRACVGLLRPSQGRIIIKKRDMTGKSYREFLQSGVAFGAAGRLEEGLIAGLTLTEHLALVNDASFMIDWKRMQAHTAAQIQHYNVRGRPDSRIEQLSGGNQQRVLMALMPRQPVLMVLEQPTRGLDVDSANWIWQQLLARRAGGTAIIFSSAELDELVAYSDRILVFYAGHIHEVPDARGATIDQLGRLIGGKFDK